MAPKEAQMMSLSGWNALWVALVDSLWIVWGTDYFLFDVVFFFSKTRPRLPTMQLQSRWVTQLEAIYNRGHGEEKWLPATKL